jgi:hypothetical protein
VDGGARGSARTAGAPGPGPDRSRDAREGRSTAPRGAAVGGRRGQCPTKRHSEATQEFIFGRIRVARTGRRVPSSRGASVPRVTGAGCPKPQQRSRFRLPVGTGRRRRTERQPPCRERPRSPIEGSGKRTTRQPRLTGARRCASLCVALNRVVVCIAVGRIGERPRSTDSEKQGVCNKVAQSQPKKGESPKPHKQTGARPK